MPTQTGAPTNTTEALQRQATRGGGATALPESPEAAGEGAPGGAAEAIPAIIDIINSPYGLEIGARHITVSTSGIVPKIKHLRKPDK